MHLYGYDEQPVTPVDEWLDPERLMKTFGVDRAAADRIIEEERDRPCPSSTELAVDGSYLFEEKAFWPAHLSYTVGEETAAEPAFGLSWADIESIGRPLIERPDRWPAFTVPLPRGGVILIIHRTQVPRSLGRGGRWVRRKAEHHMEFWLAPPSGDGMLLADVSAERLGPGLRWPELKGIAQAGAPDRREIARRLLLLAPILGDKEQSDEAVAWFARALSLMGGLDRLSMPVRRAADGLANGNELFGYASWRHDDDIWICDGIDSARNPAGHLALPPRDLRRAGETLQSLVENP